MHAACLPIPQCITPPTARGRPVANAAQGYRLGLPSTAHASLAGAAKTKKKQFSDPCPRTPFLSRKQSLGRPAATAKMSTQFKSPFWSYK